EAVGYLSAARRPLIAIGGGAIDAAQEVIALAEALNAPVVNTVNAKGVIPCGHPLAIGGSGSCELIRQELNSADVVLAVGPEFGETDYAFFFAGPVQIGGSLIRIDIDAQQLTRNVKPTVSILSDAALGLAAINAELAKDRARLSDGPERAGALRAAVRAT